MTKKEYYRVLRLTWRVLIDCNITELPVNMGVICDYYGIKALKYSKAIQYFSDKISDQNESNSDGFTAAVNGKYIIAYNEKCTIGRCRFTVAHEIGHILLGHALDEKLVNREPSPNDNPFEKAANMFAARLLAPSCVLYGCNVHTSEDISKLCNISMQSANYRAERMKELHRREKFFTIDDERKVYEQFKGFIKNHN